MLGWYALWHRLEPDCLFVAAQANQNHHPTHQHGSMKAHLKEAHAATAATELLEIVTEALLLTALLIACLSTATAFVYRRWEDSSCGTT